LTYYRQRDGIVKSIGGLIRGPPRPHPDCLIGVKTAKPSRTAPDRRSWIGQDGHQLPLF
jgi:hypothetical protein